MKLSLLCCGVLLFAYVHCEHNENRKPSSPNSPRTNSDLDFSSFDRSKYGNVKRFDQKKPRDNEMEHLLKIKPARKQLQEDPLPSGEDLAYMMSELTERLTGKALPSHEPPPRRTKQEEKWNVKRVPSYLPTLQETPDVRAKRLRREEGYQHVLEQYKSNKEKLSPHYADLMEKIAAEAQVNTQSTSTQAKTSTQQQHAPTPAAPPSKRTPTHQNQQGEKSRPDSASHRPVAQFP